MTGTVVTSKVTWGESASKLTHVALDRFEVLVVCLLEKSVSLPFGFLHRITSYVALCFSQVENSREEVGRGDNKQSVFVT